MNQIEVVYFITVLTALCLLKHQQAITISILVLIYQQTIMESLNILRLKSGDTSGIFQDYFNVVEIMSDKQFKEDFRMSRKTFELLHQKLASTDHFKSSSRGKEMIDSEKCLLIGLWILANPDSYRSIARRFAVSKSSIVECLDRVVIALVMDVCPNAIRLPRTNAERQAIAENFEDKAGFRNILGAIDGCQIKIQAPPRDDKEVYFDRKKNYSILLQGLCDADGFFINVDIRWPGSVHDARAFQTSDLHEVSEEVCGNKYHFIGDAAHPLRSYLMRPFRRTHLLNRRQKLFNTVLSSFRQVIERAFGRLKCKFRRLLYLNRHRIEDSVATIVACCVLHNICLANEEYVRELIFGPVEDAEAENVFQDDERVNCKVKRQTIVDYLWELHRGH